MQKKTNKYETSQEKAEKHYNNKEQESRQSIQSSNNQIYEKTRLQKLGTDKTEKGKQREKEKKSKEHNVETSIMQHIEEHQDMLQEILRKLNNLDNRQGNPAYSS